MASSLIPERPLLISPTLAATIGLEEAVMLHVLSEMTLRLPVSCVDDQRWMTVSQEELSEAMPFWNLADIKRIQQNLLEKGLILLDSTGGKGGQFKIAINQPAGKATGFSIRTSNYIQPPKGPDVYSPSASGKAAPIPDDWRPGDELYQQCRQRNIPGEFVDEHVRSFIIYWQERGKAQYSWSNTFLKYIVREWEREKSYQGAKELESQMSADWQPSEDVFTILEHAGINRSFIEDAVPEFVLYWRERGIVHSTWGTRFIAHVRKQWAKYEAALEHDAAPKLIPEDYHPSDEVYEILGMANIDEDFARSLIPEFVFYWRERKEVSNSWHTKFLQHVKYKWARKEKDDKDFIERVTDRSWAD